MGSATWKMIPAVFSLLEVVSDVILRMRSKQQQKIQNTSSGQKKSCILLLVMALSLFGTTAVQDAATAIQVYPTALRSRLCTAESLGLKSLCMNHAATCLGQARLAGPTKVLATTFSPLIREASSTHPRHHWTRRPMASFVAEL